MKGDGHHGQRHVGGGDVDGEQDREEKEGEVLLEGELREREAALEQEDVASYGGRAGVKGCEEPWVGELVRVVSFVVHR